MSTPISPLTLEFLTVWSSPKGNTSSSQVAQSAKTEEIANNQISENYQFQITPQTATPANSYESKEVKNLNETSSSVKYIYTGVQKESFEFLVPTPRLNVQTDFADFYHCPPSNSELPIAEKPTFTQQLTQSPETMTQCWESDPEDWSDADEDVVDDSAFFRPRTIPQPVYKPLYTPSESYQDHVERMKRYSPYSRVSRR